MVQFLSINFFLGFLQFLLGFSEVPILLCHPVCVASSAECDSVITIPKYFDYPLRMCEKTFVTRCCSSKRVIQN